MSTIDYIRRSLQTSRNLTLALIDDLKDAPMQVPTTNGGNPPIWILGHLTYGEANIVESIIEGKPNPLLSWDATFGAGKEPSTELESYPPWDELRATFETVREKTLALLDRLDDADLEKPVKKCPEGREDFFGTIEQCMMVLTLHPLMHYGQLTDSRRVLGRAPLRR
ncbi:DinB family protein [Roseiconus lacunae]|uniref:DinB family protein n=1 Tax=Roseiconus lacunae TaxID=2605694 RepID=UPI001E3EB4CA|nr:DinB family protein [Roseiconus lacunae]MCD0461273.1 DinB family protein [Roseiconus lacunae]